MNLPYPVTSALNSKENPSEQSLCLALPYFNTTIVLELEKDPFSFIKHGGDIWLSYDADGEVSLWKTPPFKTGSGDCEKWGSFSVPLLIGKMPNLPVKASESKVKYSISSILH